LEELSSLLPKLTSPSVISATNLAGTFARAVSIGVLLVVRMTLRAVRLTGIATCEAITPEKILPLRHGLQMCRTMLISDGLHAELRGAAVRLDVIELESLGDRGDQQFVDETVGSDRIMPDGEQAITFIILSTGP
jgi:hypothetical protein